MDLFTALFQSSIGLWSIFTIAFVIGMMGWFTWFFIKKSYGKE